MFNSLLPNLFHPCCITFPLKLALPCHRISRRLPLESPRFDLHRTDENMKSIERLNAWDRAIGRINWVMNTLRPIAEVHTIPFLLSSTELTSTQLFPPANMVHSLLSVIPKAHPFVSFQTRCSCHVRLDDRCPSNRINMTTASKPAQSHA